ncbi:acetyltransferase [Neisseria arctica]|uniref:[Ribosomal protein bS18]-alanine N-acetyltransferase n=1 Tax=Neisseria arctica TaxID=1470200 RepID=A0A0J1C2S9_9NEIS|nr:ribosomal protein S18-alanine N-acetyltransferase [Neisseria arctica]KLT72613.1 acetyltransferase [Neisseria arctica]UOO86307.1 ribosomal protein S18-alanine N-acetyltransferase [Neisseria arctica]
MWEIRRAIEADCRALANLDATGNPSPWTDKQFQTALYNRHNEIWVIENKQTLAGFIVWQTIADESELHLLAVNPAFRRLGLASKLLQKWFEKIKEQTVKRCLLEVRAGNQAAQALYVKHGFCECGRRRHYYSLPDGNREDAVWMEKIC